MKKIILGFAFALSFTACNAQMDEEYIKDNNPYLRAFSVADTCRPKVCYPFQNTDNLQIYSALKSRFGQNSLTDSCRPVTCFKFINTDLLQIYSAIKGINTSAFTASAWKITGNTVSGSSNKFGSLNSANVHVITNGTTRLSFLSTGHIQFISDIYDAGNNLTVDVQNKTLSNLGGVQVDFDNSLLQVSGTTSLDWGNGREFDGLGNLSIDWPLRYTAHSSGVKSGYDWENRIFWFNNTVKIMDGGQFYLYGVESPQNTSLDFGQRRFYDVNGTLLGTYASTFFQFHSASVADIFGTSGNSMRIGSDPDGTAGGKVQLIAFSPTGGVGWVSGVDYENVSSGRPLLTLQPGGGKTKIIGGIYPSGNDTISFNADTRGIYSSTGNITFSGENGEIFKPNGTKVFDAANSNILQGSDVRINFSSGFIYYQNTNVFCDWGNARFYNSNGTTKVMEFYDAGKLDIFPSGNGRVLVGGTSADASAVVDIQSTTQGILWPRMTTAERTSIGSPAEGLVVYDLTLHTPYYFNGTIWVSF